MASGEITKWVIDNIFKPERLSTVLLIIFLLIFMGVLPSPMLDAVTRSDVQHRGMEGVMRQICMNGAKDQLALNGCWYGPTAPGVVQQK